MENPDEIKEYVLRQSGCVFVGSEANPRPRQWHFGQVSYHGSSFTNCIC